ncbi:MAG: WYL domain-containing protein [Elainella sp.]
MYLYPDWTQIFTLRLYLEVLAVLLSTPLFWLFLGLAAVGHWATRRQVKHQPRPQQAQKQLQKVGAVSSGAAEQSSLLVSDRPARTVFQKVLQADVATNQKLELLEWAIQSSQKVEFDYENRYGARSHRLVIPIEFKIVGQAICLAGYCRFSKAKRVFAIQRMTNISLIAASQADQGLLPDAQDSLLDSTEQVTANLRPFLKYYVDELEKIASLEWHNRDTLVEIQNELNFRTRKKARELRERIAKRLTELQRIARPSTRMSSKG